ncbi:cell wall hydrolase [Bacillus marinisedimentorum]|uniref:cell wall hydrolase n=1 Tax=Bacillus marinisedimentorum TaxID=1821260 RepID=UPI000872941A|nr:cell wall hydrolase [Bacillus marinisedimentorum]
MKNAAIIFLVIIFTLSGMSAAQAASNHTVKQGESLWSIARYHGVPVAAVKKINNRYSNMIYSGEQLKIPTPVSSKERDLLARLVRAEAEGEPYAGKVAVATVVLNRVDSKKFPDSVTGVVYEKSYGHYAFTPVKNGEINRPADFKSKKAVNEALAYRGQGSGSLYFFNPQTSVSKWVFSREVTVTIGKHRFAK